METRNKLIKQYKEEVKTSKIKKRIDDYLDLIDDEKYIEIYNKFAALCSDVHRIYPMSELGNFIKANDPSFVAEIFLNSEIDEFNSYDDYFVVRKTGTRLDVEFNIVSCSDHCTETLLGEHEYEKLVDYLVKFLDENDNQYAVEEKLNNL